MQPRTERMPSVTFSDDADYDGMFTVFDRLKDFAFTWILTNGEHVEGGFTGEKGDGTFLVAVYEEGTPTGEVRRIDADFLVTAVYL